MAKYEIKVHMGASDKFTGKKGPFFMKINSDEIEGSEFILNSEKFTAG